MIKGNEKLLYILSWKERPRMRISETSSERFLKHLQKLGNHSSVFERNLGSNQALSCHLLSQVVRRPINANPGLNFNLGFFFFCSKGFSPIIFSILFRASNHQIGKRIKLNLLFKLPYLNSNFALTLGYLNPALNNPALKGEKFYERDQKVGKAEKYQLFFNTVPIYAGKLIVG